jgi:SAM-dependent methyltransferase
MISPQFLRTASFLSPIIFGILEPKERRVMDVVHLKVQMIAEEFIKDGDPLGWFEKVYSDANGDVLSVPWASLSPHPKLIEWLKKNHRREEGLKALVIGCGLGDDAEELSRNGFKVTAFDISPTAIEWCKKRFPKSKADYRVVDLFQSPAEWNHSFDFVFESRTLQSLPPPLRPQAIEQIVQTVGLYGKLLVVARGRDLEQEIEGPPWPLIKAELKAFKKCGLKEMFLEDYLDSENSPGRHFFAGYVAIDPQLAEKWKEETSPNDAG